MLTSASASRREPTPISAISGVRDIERCGAFCRYGAMTILLFRGSACLLMVSAIYSAHHHTATRHQHMLTMQYYDAEHACSAESLRECPMDAADSCVSIDMAAFSLDAGAIFSGIFVRGSRVLRKYQLQPHTHSTGSSAPHGFRYSLAECADDDKAAILMVIWPLQYLVLACRSFRHDVLHFWQ